MTDETKEQTRIITRNFVKVMGMGCSDTNIDNNNCIGCMCKKECDSRFEETGDRMIVMTEEKEGE